MVLFSDAFYRSPRVGESLLNVLSVYLCAGVKRVARRLHSRSINLSEHIFIIIKRQYLLHIVQSFCCKVSSLWDEYIMYCDFFIWIMQR